MPIFQKEILIRHMFVYSIFQKEILYLYDWFIYLLLLLLYTNIHTKLYLDYSNRAFVKKRTFMYPMKIQHEKMIVGIWGVVLSHENVVICQHGCCL